jgi:hypothetical protein
VRHVRDFSMSVFDASPSQSRHFFIARHNSAPLPRHGQRRHQAESSSASSNVGVTRTLGCRVLGVMLDSAATATGKPPAEQEVNARFEGHRGEGAGYADTRGCPSQNDVRHPLSRILPVVTFDTDAELMLERQVERSSEKAHRRGTSGTRRPVIPV